MSFWQKVLDAFTVKALTVPRSSIITLGVGRPTWSGATDFRTLALEGYSKNADVYSAVSLIATAARQIEFGAYVGKGETLREVENHEALRLLRNPMLIEQMVASLLISGNAFLHIDPPIRPREIMWLRSDRMRIKPGPRVGEVVAFEYVANGATGTVYAPEQIIHIKFFNPLDDLFGMSPLHAAMRAVDTQNTAMDLNKALLENQGRPSGALTTEQNLTDEQFHKLQAQIEGKFSGENFRKPALFEGGLKWEEMGLRPADLEHIEGLKLTKRYIASCLHVPAELIGDTDSKTFSNFREARRGLYTEGVIPIVKFIRDVLNARLMPLFPGNVYLEIDLDKIDALAGDRDAAWERSTKGYDAGIVTLNEARAELGFDAISGGDRFKHEIQPSKVTPSSSKTEDDARVSYWLEFDAARKKHERSMIADIRSAFEAEEIAVVAAFEAGGMDAALKAIDDTAWARLILRHDYDTAREFGGRIWNDLRSQGGNVETKAVLDVFTNAVRAWLSKNAASRVRGITDWTREMVRSAIMDGVELGEGIFELAQRIRKVYAGFSASRAERIARTEVVSASNLGSVAAAEATGLPLKKEWLATPDERTRGSHSLADGQVVELKADFQVGGFPMAFPGDSSRAPVHEFINCRCTQTYRIDQ